MDNQLEWKEEFDIGVRIIDEEHRRLFKIINKLFALGEEERKSKKACQEGIKYFKEHAMKHFEDEEKYMELTAYEDLEMHRRIHKGFRENTLPALEQELARESYSPDSVDHFLGVCAGWLIGHTLTEDQAIVGEKESKWGELLPETQLSDLKRVIGKMLYDMFQLKAQVISEAYGGERFGKGVYYRLIYGREPDEKKWEIILVFEEKLLINTVGKIMGVQSNKLNVMLLNAVRYTASQFVGRVIGHFPSAESYELVEENLLTYEQFQEVFEDMKPQVSLLFDTNAGYFSYCMFAPHLLQGGIGTPIVADNVMKEVEKYLRARDKEPLRKILVVDDSMTIRMGMRRLLAGRYEVSEVDSGVAAIRAVTLDRPDLILLDYEMPVCDGSHVFEMLRSEKEFEDIPVIFLTSRDDPESVKRVLSLKPEGYLLKYLKPADIRCRIDEFFMKLKV
ncbi:MAG: response regulator [Lachnospiraceae bacterium]|jgi:hemerythrin-like metal-binding protein|nr:response regulator [Lachnospiraceae bacterium]